MKTISVILCLLGCVITMNSMAQTDTARVCTYTFSGRVIDGETKAPLIGAGVILKNSGTMSVASDSGEFRFSGLCKGEYEVECQSLGYKPVIAHIKITGNTVRDFVLHSDTCILQSVVVTSTSTVAPTEYTQQSVEVKGKEIDRTTGFSLGQMLRSVPGVSTLQSGPSIFKPVINGMYGNRVLILNNGVRQEGQQWGVEHAPEIDPFIASKVTVVKGASSVQYGSDAIGGVILVDPEELRKEPGFTGTIRRAAIFNNKQATVSLRMDWGVKKIKGLSFRLQGTYKQAGNSKTPDYYMKNTGFREHNFSWAAGYKRKKFSTELYYSLFNTRLGIFSASHIGNLTDLDSALASPVPLEKAGFSYKIDRPYQHVLHELFKVQSQYKFNRLGKMQVILARQFNYRAEYDKHRSYQDQNGDDPQIQFKITTHTANVQLEHIAIRNVTGLTGVSFIRQANTTRGTVTALIPNFISYAGGLFLIERWRQGRLELEAGARYDYKWMKVYRYEGELLQSPEYRFGNVSGTAGALYTLSDFWKVRFNAGTAYRPVTVSELYSEGLHHGAARLEYGNRNLRSEYAYNTSLTFDYKYKRIYGQINAYNNYIHNYIYLAPGQVYDSARHEYVAEKALTVRGAFPVFRYKQINAQFTGLDFSFNDSLSRNIIVSTRFSLLRAYNTKAREYIILTPPANLEYGIQYSFSFSKKITNTYLRANHLLVARKSRVPVNEDLTPPPPAYMLFSLEAGCIFIIKGEPLNVIFSVYNLFNTRYRDYMDRFRYYSDGIGRSFALRVKVPLVSGKKKKPKATKNEGSK